MGQVKNGFLGQVRRLLGSLAGEFVERGDGSSRDAVRLAKARSAIHDELGLLFVEQRRIEKDRAASANELETLLGKATFAVAEAREDLARAALVHRDRLERRLAELEQEQQQIRAGIATLEETAASLDHPHEGATGASLIAAQLAELDRLLQAQTPDNERKG